VLKKILSWGCSWHAIYLLLGVIRRWMVGER